MVSRTAQPKSLSSFALRVSVSSGLYRPPTEAFAGASRVGGVNSAQAAARGDKLSLQPASKTDGSPVSSSCFHRKANRKSCTVCARETVQVFLGVSSAQSLRVVSASSHAVCDMRCELREDTHFGRLGCVNCSEV
ncbi:hypothetical protein DIPPA_27512 [Diplonema papillatum]|nr:hypothetical protein DIPPA_27512 [Diplonema papillatum]